MNKPKKQVTSPDRNANTMLFLHGIEMNSPQDSANGYQASKKP